MKKWRVTVRLKPRGGLKSVVVKADDKVDALHAGMDKIADSVAVGIGLSEPQVKRVGGSWVVVLDDGETYSDLEGCVIAWLPNTTRDPNEAVRDGLDESRPIEAPE